MGSKISWQQVKTFLPLLVMLAVMPILLSSCNELTQVQKSTSIVEKYSYAKKFYNTGKYEWAATLLEEVVPYLQGSADGEEALYLMGQAYYHDERYPEATEAFKRYYGSYPQGEYAELARFYAGYGLAQNVPDPRLDQAQTYDAIRELQLFVDYYPQSERADEALTIIFDLQEHLAEKELYNIELYYNLGNYIFNNYESCIITARNAMRDYPYSMYKQDMHFYVLSSLYQIAKYSIEEKQQQRLRDLRDEYYSFINDFPEGKHRKKADEYFSFATANIRD